MLKLKNKKKFSSPPPPLVVYPEVSHGIFDEVNKRFNVISLLVEDLKFSNF